MGNPTITTYDNAGNVAQVTDAELRVKRFQYDALNRRTKIINASNSDPDPACSSAGVACFAYDEAGNLVNVTDPNGNVMSYLYDSLDRLNQQTDPFLKSVNFDYDLDGELERITDRKGQVTEFAYDAVKRLVTRTLQPGAPEESVRTVAYDSMDNITSINDPDSSLTFTYDTLNRPATATTGGPHQADVTLTYGYNKNDKRTSLDDELVETTTYLYDTLNRLTDVQGPGGDFTFGYDVLTRRTSIGRDNGVATTFTYDVAGRVTSIIHDLAGSTVSSFTYGHDDVDKRTSLDQVRPTLSATSAIAYGYNELDRVTSATSAVMGGTDESYSYDPLGNRIASHRSAAHVTGSGNRLLEDDAFCYAYDDNGNLITRTIKVAGACSGGTTSYGWDAENRLTRIDFPGGGFAEYRYDALRRRIVKDVDGVVTRYVYDAKDILFEFDGSNVLRARYTHGARIDEPLLVQRDEDGSGLFEADEAFTYHTDDLGSVTEITNSAGTVAASTLYDSYGNLLAETGTLDQPYAFTGREIDRESGDYYYRARYLQPAAGRFGQEDPLGIFSGGLNFYLYVGANPVNLSDPTGLIPCKCKAKVTGDWDNEGAKWCTYTCTCTGTCGKESPPFDITVNMGTSGTTICDGQVNAGPNNTYFNDVFFDSSDSFLDALFGEASTNLINSVEAYAVNGTGIGP